MSDTIGRTSAAELERQFREWEANEVADFVKRAPERREAYFTLGDIPVKRTYTGADIAGTPVEDIGLPGRYPFTRGPYPTMYRGRNWTMRQIAGFGTGEDTNHRFKFLIEQGQTGISTDFDMPTLMGYDSDHPMSDGEVGREGVAIDTLADMEALLDGIDIENISVSLTINPTAWILFAMYVVLAQKRGYDLDKLSGTVQADILKEIYGAEGVHFSDHTVGAHRARPDRLFGEKHEALQSDQHLGIPHLGGRLLASTRGRLHAGQSHRLRRGGDEARSRRRRLRATPCFLLRQPDRLFRGGRQVPGRCGAAMRRS